MLLSQSNLNISNDCDFVTYAEFLLRVSKGKQFSELNDLLFMGTL